ncbi:hypothetical protein UF37_13045 [Vibrio parahaemolyticus]|nr:hypothetical protein UF37_13045 [Vibrio parahaemolyticus]
MFIGDPYLFSVLACTALNQTEQAIEIVAMTMGIYLTLSLLSSALMNLYNRRVALVARLYECKVISARSTAAIKCRWRGLLVTQEFV